MKKAQHLRVGPFTTVRWKEASDLKAWWTLETARQLEGSTSFAPQEQQGQPANKPAVLFLLEPLSSRQLSWLLAF